MNRLLIIFFTFLFPLCIWSQPPSENGTDKDSEGKAKPINIQSDRMLMDEEKFPGAIILTKVDEQVYMIHEGIEIWCDQAIHYKEDRFVKAFGNVKMKQGDTITMTSAYAEYNGQTEFAYASQSVNLVTPQYQLQSDTLFFDRLRQQAYYRSGGVIRDSTNTYKSKIGRHYMEKKQFRLNNDVEITNQENVVNTNHLDYFQDTGYAYVYGPSTVKGEESVLYCERGFYDTKAKVGYAIKNARIDYDNRTVYGDSIFYNSAEQFASATNNIKILDTANSSLIKGHYAEVFKAKDSLFITKRALAITLQEKDSIYIHSDTLMVTGKPEKRIMRGFYDVRIFKKTMSGKSDSIHVDQTTGYTKLLTDPVLWSDRSQLTGDTIMLISDKVTEKLDSLKVYENSFMAQEDTLQEGFNQVKGKILYGLFKDNELYQIDVDKNTETIVYQRNDAQELIGINKVISSSIRVLFEDRDINDVYYYQQVTGTLYPESELPKEARELSGLLWRGDEKITSKADLFRGESPPVLTKIKGLPLPEDDVDFFDEETIKRLEDKGSEESRLKTKDYQDAETETIGESEIRSDIKEEDQNSDTEPNSIKVETSVTKPEIE